MTPTTRPAPLSLRPNRKLAANLDARGDSQPATIRRDLERYYDSIETALREVLLSEAEWNFLRDLLNGTLVQSSTAQYLWAEVEDADPELSAKWGVDQHDLPGRLRTMPAFTRLAICDAVERWWREQR